MAWQEGKCFKYLGKTEDRLNKLNIIPAQKLPCLCIINISLPSFASSTYIASAALLCHLSTARTGLGQCEQQRSTSSHRIGTTRAHEATWDARRVCDAHARGAKPRTVGCSVRQETSSLFSGHGDGLRSLP